MTKEFTIYIVGDFKSGAADGLAEFNYQNVKLLQSDFRFEFIEFDRQQPADYCEVEVREGLTVNRFGMSGVPAYKLSQAFVRWFDRLDPLVTVFHLSHVWNIRNYLIAKRLVRKGISYLITPHDSYVYGRTYNSSRPFFKRCYRWALVRMFDKYVLDHAKVIHGLTPYCEAFLKSLSSSAVIVVANQVKDTGIPLDIARVSNQVCFIGRISIFQKGVDLALLAFASFVRGNASPDARFVLIGPADQAASEACLKICKGAGVEPGRDVVFAGKVSEEQRNSTLSTSKVYLQLSRYEGFGLSVVQALSAFKPVIVSAGIPIAEVILKYKAGFVVHSAAEATDALSKVWAMSPHEYETMALNARRCYEQEFYPGVIKPQLIRLYESVFSE
jgi:glycosyltransferase involved in cell wall biosynthesis